MSKVDKLDLVIEKIQDLKDLQNEKIDNLENSITGFQARLSAHQKFEEKELTEIRIDLNNHMERTRLAEQSLVLLRQLHQDNQRRIDVNSSIIEKSGEKVNKIISKVSTLEEPSKARKYMMNGLKGFGAAAISILSILKFIDFIK